MAQWINVLRNNGFIKPTRLPLLCEKTGALAQWNRVLWEAIRQTNML